MTRLPPLAVTPGDPDGIGPEIVWKSVRYRRRWDPSNQVSFFCVGAELPFRRLRARIEQLTSNDLLDPDLARRIRANPAAVWLLAAPETAPGRRLLPGFQSGWSIEHAVSCVKNGQAAALVTGPISKERLQLGGYPYPGHTEFLASLAGQNKVTMMLANEQLRVALVTTHIALRDISKKLTKEKIERCIDQTLESLRLQWGIKRPRIAVTGLNPHAGENGLFGEEEKKTIRPAIVRSAKKWSGLALIDGPFPADTLFAQHHLAKPARRWDAIVCMYHDQGLIPVKLLDFPKTVNVTLGLPWIRTSVDHGTGFDIAGKGLADPSSFQSALRLATRLSRRSKIPS